MTKLSETYITRYRKVENKDRIFQIVLNKRLSILKVVVRLATKELFENNEETFDLSFLETKKNGFRSFRNLQKIYHFKNISGNFIAKSIFR